MTKKAYVKPEIESIGLSATAKCEVEGTVIDPTQCGPVAPNATIIGCS